MPYKRLQDLSMLAIQAPPLHWAFKPESCEKTHIAALVADSLEDPRMRCGISGPILASMPEKVGLTWPAPDF